MEYLDPRNSKLLYQSKYITLDYTLFNIFIYYHTYCDVIKIIKCPMKFIGNLLMVILSFFPQNSYKILIIPSLASSYNNSIISKRHRRVRNMLDLPEICE